MHSWPSITIVPFIVSSPGPLNPGSLLTSQGKVLENSQRKSFKHFFKVAFLGTAWLIISGREWTGWNPGRTVI